MIDRKKIKEIENLLNKKIKEGLKIELEFGLNYFSDLLIHINDGFYIDIDIIQEYNCFPASYFLLVISYEEDVLYSDEKVNFIFEYEEDGKFINITELIDINDN